MMMMTDRFQFGFLFVSLSLSLSLSLVVVGKKERATRKSAALSLSRLLLLLLEREREREGERKRDYYILSPKAERREHLIKVVNRKSADEMRTLFVVLLCGDQKPTQTKRFLKP